jgi:hypothetical protein
MEYTDEELARQPVGYWTGAAHEAVIRYIGEEHGKLGVTQRHWMALNAVVRLGAPTRQEVTDDLRQYLSPQIGDVSTFPTVLDDLLTRRWLALDTAGRLALTEDGSAGRARIAARTADIRATMHEGVKDEDYVVTLKVLRRIIGNVTTRE